MTVQQYNRLWEWIAGIGEYGVRLNSWAWAHRRCECCGGRMDGPPCHGVRPT